MVWRGAAVVEKGVGYILFTILRDACVWRQSRGSSKGVSHRPLEGFTSHLSACVDGTRHPLCTCSGFFGEKSLGSDGCRLISGANTRGGVWREACAESGSWVCEVRVLG